MAATTGYPTLKIFGRDHKKEIVLTGDNLHWISLSSNCSPRQVSNSRILAPASVAEISNIHYPLCMKVVLLVCQCLQATIWAFTCMYPIMLKIYTEFKIGT